MKKIDPFFKKIKKITNIPCELVDERLTSFEAKELAKIDSKLDRIDHLSAKLFLDNWIDHHVDSIFRHDFRQIRPEFVVPFFVLVVTSHLQLQHHSH